MRLRLSLGFAVVAACIFYLTTGFRDGEALFDSTNDSAAANVFENKLVLPADGNGDSDDATTDERPIPTALCPDNTPSDLKTHDDEWFKARTLRHAKALSVTNDAEYLLAAALLIRHQRPTESLVFLERATKLAPTNRIIASTWLRNCRERQTSECDMDRVIANALKVDGDNGAVLMEVAMLSLTANRIAEAEALVRRAADAPRFDHYFIDYAKVLERAAATRGDSNYRDRMFEGIGYSAAMSVSYSEITTFCNAIERQDLTWLELCDDLGRKMQTAGRSILDNLIGARLQEMSANQSQIKRRIETATAAHNAFRQRYVNNQQSKEGMGLLENDEVVLRRYVDTFTTYGEMVALEVLNTEVTRLKAMSDYDECNFIPSYWPDELH